MVLWGNVGYDRVVAFVESNVATSAELATRLAPLSRRCFFFLVGSAHRCAGWRQLLALHAFRNIGAIRLAVETYCRCDWRCYGSADDSRPNRTKVSAVESPACNDGSL